MGSQCSTGRGGSPVGGYGPKSGKAKKLSFEHAVSRPVVHKARQLSTQPGGISRGMGKSQMKSFLINAFRNEEDSYIKRFRPPPAASTGHPSMNLPGRMPHRVGSIREVRSLGHQRPYFSASQLEAFEDIVAQARATGEAWIDPYAPPLADSSHIYVDPADIFQSARSFVFSRASTDTVTTKHYNEIKQGLLGDCWFLAAMSGIAQLPHLMDAVCSNRDDEFGVYEFTFHKNGQRIPVCVDRSIPMDSQRRKFVYTTAREPSELWPSLMEKAYAKLHGGYPEIVGGLTAFGYADLTGGEPVFWMMGKGNEDNFPPPPQEELISLIERNYNQGFPMGASFRSVSKVVVGNSGEQSGANGLVAGHAYTITGIHRGKITLVRLRNPWGKGEWRGAWSDSWEGWAKHPDMLHLKVNEEDGEFWMSAHDFTQQVKRINACQISFTAYNQQSLAEEEYVETSNFDGPRFSDGGYDYDYEYHNKGFYFDYQENGGYMYD